MKNQFLTCLAVGVLALAGCSTPTKVDKGPIRAASFNFIATAPANASFADKFAGDFAPIHGYVQQAITSNLGGKGLRKVATGGDVTVAYLIVTGNNVSTTMIDDYFGYGPDKAALVGKAHDAYTSSKNPNYFEAGTLLIDVIDSRSHELLKRTHVTRPILRDATAEVRQARIQEAVDDALKDLRIKH